MEKQPKDILELANQIYNEWGDKGWKNNADFIRDVKEKNAEDFAISLHRGLGMEIRNNFGLWSGDTPLYHYCKSIGLNHADDMSHRILMEVHKYATEQLSK